MNRDSIKQKQGGGAAENDNNNWEIKTSGNRKPSWYANIVQPIKFTKLTRNVSGTDVAIVGGGE
jgi:hypothetical protein